VDSAKDYCRIGLAVGMRQVCLVLKVIPRFRMQGIFRIRPTGNFGFREREAFSESE